jgi:hypothetical protein
MSLFLQKLLDSLPMPEVSACSGAHENEEKQCGASKKPDEREGNDGEGGFEGFHGSEYSAMNKWNSLEGAPGLSHPCPFPATKPPIPYSGQARLPRLAT